MYESITLNICFNQSQCYIKQTNTSMLTIIVNIPTGGLTVPLHN